MKTLFLYAALVFLLVLTSLTIKAFFIFQKSKFDGRHHFTVAVTREGKVEEIISFNPRVPSLAVLEIQNSKLTLSAVGSTLAVAPDAIINAKNNLSRGEDVTGTLFSAFTQFPSIHTDLTIFDIGRLLFLSKNISEENKIIKKITLPRQESDIDKMIASFFGDETLRSENISIQIVNASDTPGIGKRLERVLNNVGCNVIKLSTSNSSEGKSKIQYRGEETYSVRKLKRLLGFPTSQLEAQSIATIVVTIGSDSKKTKAF